MNTRMILAVFVLSPRMLLATPDLSRGVVAFEERKWSEAMEAFLETLRQDPKNTEAHAYVNLIAREMEAERQAIVRAHRLQMLGEASKRLEGNNHDTGPIQQAILDTHRAAKTAEEEKW